MSRSFLGAELKIVVLKLPQTVLKKRLVQRHGSDEETLNYLMVTAQNLRFIITSNLLELCPEGSGHRRRGKCCDC